MYANFLRIMLYLFTIYSVVSASIMYMKSNKNLFFVHISVSILLLLNLIGVVFIRVLGIYSLDTIIFGYGTTVILLILNFLIWKRFYFTSKSTEKKENDLLSKLNIDDFDGSRNLLEIANS